MSTTSNQILLASDWKKLIDQYFNEIRADTSLNLSRVQSDIQMLYHMFARNVLNVYEKFALIGSPLFNYCYTKNGQQAPGSTGLVWPSFQPSVAVFFGPKQGSVMANGMIAKIFNKANYNNVSPQSYLFFGGYYYNAKGYCLADFVKSMSYILGIWYEPKAQVSSVGEANSDGEYKADENLDPFAQSAELSDGAITRDVRARPEAVVDRRSGNSQFLRLPQVPGTYPIPPIPRSVLYKKKNPKFLARPPGVFNFSVEVMDYLANHDNLNQTAGAVTLSYMQNLTLVGRTDRLFYEIFGNQWCTKVTRKTVKTNKKRLKEVKQSYKAVKYNKSTAKTLLSDYNMVNFEKYSTFPTTASLSRGHAICTDITRAAVFDPNGNQGQNTITQAGVFNFSARDYESFSIRQTLAVLGQIIFGKANISQGTYSQNIYRDTLLKRSQFNQLNIQSKLSHLHSVLKKMVDDEHDNEIYKYTGKRLKVQKITPITTGLTLRNFQRSLNLSSQTQFLAKEAIKTNAAVSRLDKRVARLERKNKNLNLKDPAIGAAIGSATTGFLNNFKKNPTKALVSLAASASANVIAVLALSLAAGNSSAIDGLTSRVEALEAGSSQGLLERIERLENLVNTQQTTINSQANKISELNTLTHRMSMEIEYQHNTDTAHGTMISDLQVETRAINTRIDNVVSTVSVVRNEVSAVRADVNTLSSDVRYTTNKVNILKSQPLVKSWVPSVQTDNNGFLRLNMSQFPSDMRSKTNDYIVGLVPYDIRAANYETVVAQWTDWNGDDGVNIRLTWQNNTSVGSGRSVKIFYYANNPANTS